MTQEIETLLEMGFSRSQAEKALAVTHNKGVEPAMEWLLQNPQGAAESVIDGATVSTAVAASGSSNAAEEAKSLKCDECGKLFKNQDEVEFHAAKSGHSSFSESTEEKKPLTEEEKKAQLVLLEERMKAKRKEREEREKEEQLERERLRIKSGKDMLDAKTKMQEQEMAKAIEQRRRDKLEDQKARDRVKKQIEADKQARREAAALAKGETIPTVSALAAPAASLPAAKPAAAVAAGSYSSCRLQLRLPDGRALTHVFQPKEQLAAVRLYVQLQAPEVAPGFGFMTTFPKKVFAEEDYDKPLEVLGLVPSAVIIVTKPTL